MNEAVLKVLIEACLRGGVEVLKARLMGDVAASYKDARELVTEADKRSDAAMLDVFRTSLPPDSGISLLLEESGQQGVPSERWIGADPIDGTNHFACGGNLYSVQAHYVVDGIPQAGVVFQPEVFLPLVEATSCLGRIAYAIRGAGAFYERTEFNGASFARGLAKPLRKRAVPVTRTFAACVPLSSKMTAGESALARKVLESGLLASSMGTGGAGGNVLMTVFGGQHVYANFGAGEDLDLIPPQVIAEEAGMTVWGLDRRPPVWHQRKQPFIVAPTPEITERFLQAAGL